jgi:hypothetical protein
LVLQALREDPSSPEANAFLEQLTGTDPSNPYAGAEELLEAGYEDEARKKAQEVAAETGAAIPPDLQDDSFEGFVDKQKVDDAIDWAASMAVLLAIVGVVLAIPVVLIRRASQRPLVMIEKLDDPAKDAPIGQALTDMLVDELESSGSGGTLERVQDAPVAQDLDVKAVLGDRWEWLSAVLTRIAARRLVRVRGDAFVLDSTEKPAKAQVGLTVNVIDHRGQVVETRTFRVTGEGTAKTVLPGLVPLAAAWVTDALARKTKATTERSMLGTTKWRSWGRFRQGVWFHTRGDRDTARVRYLDAIEEDGCNIGAWLNLANLDVRDEKGWDTAIERLEVVASLVNEQAKPCETLWFRALYLRAVTKLHRSTSEKRTPAQRQSDREGAIRDAVMLVRLMAVAHLQLASPTPTPPFAALDAAQRDDLRNLIDTTDLIAVSLLASALVNDRDVPPADFTPPAGLDRRSAFLWFAVMPNRPTAASVLTRMAALRDGRPLPVPAEYNLACLYARAFSNAADAPDQREEFLTCALRHLERGVEGSRAQADDARNDDVAFDAIRKDPAAKAKLVETLDKVFPPAAPTSSTDGWKLVVAG